MPAAHRTVRCCLFLFMLCGQYPANAQEIDTPAPGRPPFTIGTSVHRGFIIAHSRKLVDISASNPYGVEVDLAWTLCDERYTRRCGMVARRGVALHLIDFDNPAVLGRVVSLTPYVEPLIRAQDRLHGSVRFGVGFAWLSRVYDAETNPTNLCFSTPLSFTAMVNAYVGYRLTPQWEVTGGFNFNHISNGGMREPNKGLNYPTWSLGAAYNTQPLTLTRPVRDDEWRSQPRRTVYALLSVSSKTVLSSAEAPGTQRCWLLGAMGMASWRTGRLTALSTGTEWVHDGFTRELLDRRNEELSAWKGAVMAGPELLSGRVRFGILFGAYVFNPSRESDVVYQRYQLMYTIGRKLLVGTSLKAHRHVADVFDLRAGWAW